MLTILQETVLSFFVVLILRIELVVLCSIAKLSALVLGNISSPFIIFETGSQNRLSFDSPAIASIVAGVRGMCKTNRAFT